MNAQLQIEIFELIAKITGGIFFFQENCSNFPTILIIPYLNLSHHTLGLEDEKSIIKDDILT